MKILVVLGHPKTGSFNHAIAETTINILSKNQVQSCSPQ
jgi:putative NADPH-quinone reductase